MLLIIKTLRTYDNRVAAALLAHALNNFQTEMIKSFERNGRGLSGISQVFDGLS